MECYLSGLANSNGHTVHTQIYTRSSSSSGAVASQCGQCVCVYTRGDATENQFPERSREHRRQAVLQRVFPFSLLLRSRGASVRALLTKAADYNLVYSARGFFFWQVSLPLAPLSSQAKQSRNSIDTFHSIVLNKTTSIVALLIFTIGGLVVNSHT